MNFEMLNRLERKGEFYREAPSWCHRIWKREESFDNFVKQHRETLKQSGVLVRVGRDYFVDRENFPAVAAGVLGFSASEAEPK